MGMIKIPNNSIKFFQNNINEIFDTGNLAEGKWNKELANYVKEMTGAKSAIPTNSNGSGLIALMSIYKYYFNRENVIIQSNTMYGVKTMVPTSGCKLNGYIECRLNTLMPSYEDVKKSIELIEKSERKKQIILLSHIGGIINPDIIKIAKLCKEEDIVLLEDCAHSLGSTLYGNHSGLFGDGGVYSFYATKAVPAGEGGIVVTNNSEIGDLVSNFSIYDRFDQKMIIGNNIRISELQALFSYSVVKEWKNIIDNKINIAKQYIDTCIDNNINFISQDSYGQKGNYYKFVIYSENSAIKAAMPSLKTVTSPVYDYCLCDCDNIINNHACLPIWYKLEQNIIDQAIIELNNS